MNTIDHSAIRKLVKIIDYSQALRIDAGEADVKSACAVARRYGFRAVVSFPQHIELMSKELAGSGVLVQVPVGFPCGGTTTAVKCFEAEQGLKHGATDLDMVMNVSAFKEGNYRRVSEDIQAVLAVARPYNVPRKVIIETGILTDEEKVTAAKIVADCGADFVKTCTAFAPGQATVHDVELLVRTVGNRIGVKASGSVIYIEDALALMNAGAAVVAMRDTLIHQLEAMDYQPSENSGENN